MAFSEKDIARRRTELQHAPNSDRFKYQKPDVSAPVNYGSSAPSSQKNNSNTSGSSQKVTGNYTEEAIARRRKELQHGGGDRFAYKGPDFSMLPAPRINPFNHLNYSDPVTQKFHQQTGWRDPGAQALYELAERTRNPQRKITPASVFRTGPIAGSDIGPRSRSAEAARQASEAARDALDQAAAGVRFNRTEAEKRRRSNAISLPGTETADDEYSGKMEQRPEWLGGQSVGEYMRDFMNSQEALGTYGADVVREYNRIYDSQGAGAAQKYVMSKDSTGNPGMERIDAFLTGVGNASGINSIAGIAMGPENYRRVSSEQQSISKAHPIASAAGAITGTLPLITTLGRFARSIPAVAGLSKAAQAVISGAAAMGGSTAIQEAGAAANGLISPGRYAGDVAVSGLAGIAGGALGNTVSQKGMQFLYNSGLINNSIARTVVAGLSGSGYSVGSTGVREASAFIRDPENYEADPIRIIKDASVAFAFGAISYIANGGTRFTMNEEASNERPTSKWFEDCSTPQEVDAKLRQYARQYHPDQPTGDADLFAEISAEATAMKAWMNVNAGAQAYQKAQEAYASGDTAKYQEAQQEYNAAVNALMVDVQSGAIQGQEAVEALQVLQSVSANLAGPEAQAPTTPESDALAALAEQRFPSTAPTTEERLLSTGTENVQVPQDAVATSQQDIPGNPYERTAAQKLDTAARQLQALEYERNQHPSVEQLNDELNSPFAVFENENPEIAQIQTRTGEQKLAALAARATENQAAQKRDQIQAIYEAGKTQNPDFQTVMDGATMLTEAEKTNAFYRGLTAAAAEAAGIGKEISYGGQQQEEGNYLSGEGSGRPVSLGVGEPVGGVRTQAGRVAEGWKDWSHSADSGIKRANVQISGGVPAEKIIRTAEPGQVIYQVESGHTPSMRKAAAMVRAYDPKVEVVPFVSGNDIRVISGEAARAFVDPERRSIGYRANDERAAGDQLARHELIELGVIDGKVDLNDALKHLSSGIREFVDDDIISDIADVYLKSAVNDVGSLSPEALSKAIQHANKEMLCDIGAGINQFDGVDGFELYAQVVDVAHDILHDYMNEKLGGAFDAEPESIPETKSVGASQADVGTALTVLKNTGISVNDNGTVAHMEYSTRYSWKTREEQEKAAAALQKTLGVSKKKALGFIQSEMSLTNMILRPGNVALMDYTPDDRYTALKKNSDYPQGTFDFNNNCRKRVPFTTLFDRIQMRNPNRLFTADDLEIIRQNMIKHNYPVACALCYVEERRQKLGEIADSFVKLYENDAVLDRFVGKTPFEKMKAALESVGDDPYKPTIADLVTYEGLKKLEKNHKGIADAFRIFNNARGMQSGRLVEGRAEYKRELLTYTPAQVKRVNDLGGIRVFSYSDFEAVNLLDLVQIIQDAASKGIMIQAYTKVPAFAKVVRNTGIKLNRSLIAAGTGVKYENGKKVLDLDPVEGININDPDFFDSTDDRDVGNILVGMSDEQIRLAMASPFVDYIIPFHTSLPGTILKAKKIDHWKNYKLSKTDKDMKTGKNAKNINIYTEVLQAAAKEGNPIKNKKDFVNKFLQVAKDKNLIPRFSEFLNTDKDGNFVYTEGYHKFLIDFKLFDKNGNIVEQKPVRPVFDDAYNTKLMEDFANGVGSVSITDELYRDTVDALNAKSEGNKIQYSSKLNLSGKQGASGQRDSSGKTLTAQQAEYFKDSKIRDEDGNLLVVYHGTSEDFNVFDSSKGRANMDIQGSFFSPWDIDAKGYGPNVKTVYLNIKNPAPEGIAYKALNMFKGQNNAGVKAREYLIRRGYDGVNNGNEEYIAFYPEQIKNIDNENPTENADIRYSSKLQLQQKRDEDYSAAIRENDTETAGRLVKEAAEDAGYTEDIYHGTGAFGFTKFDLGKMDDGASIFATTDRRVAESYSGETNRELISKRAGESVDAIIDRIDGAKDEDLLPLIKENLDPKYKRVPQERLAEMRDERVNDIRFYADKIMDFMDDNPGMFDEAKSIAASRLASSMYKLSRARSADEVDEYLTQYNEDAWELKFMDENAFYEMFDGSSGIAATNNAIRDLGSLLESDVMFTNGEKKPGSTLDVLTPGEARTRLIGEMSKGIYHLYGKNENMLEFDANGDNWNMIDTARISNKAFRIKSTSNKDKAWLSGLYMPYNDAQSLAARAARDANGEDDYLDVKDLRDPLGRISGWEFRSHKTGEMVMELESALPSRAMTRDIAKYAREVGYDGVIMRNLKDSGGATAYNQPSDVYIYFKPNAVKSADTVTYDDGGNAIPLSERFKTGEDDIRYSSKLDLRRKQERDNEYMDAVNTGDIAKAAKMVSKAAEESGFKNAIPEQTLAYKVRTGKAPTRTKKVYKVFTVAPDGSPTALFVSGTQKLPQGVWLDAQDTWHFKAKNGKYYVPSTQNPYTEGGKTGGMVEIPNEEIRNELIERGFLPEGSKAKSVTALAYRPGWHAGDLPFFPQGGKQDKEYVSESSRAKANKEVFSGTEEHPYQNYHRYNQVVFECEMAFDKDYTKSHIGSEKGKASYGKVVYEDMQEMPVDGGYKFATNPMANANDIGSWFISGSLKIGRALSQEECDTILRQNGRLPQLWEQGKLDLASLGYTGPQKDAARKTLAPVTYDDEGNVIPLSARFDPDVDDVRYSTKLNLQGKEIELTEREEKLMEQLNEGYLKRIEQVTVEKDAQIEKLKEQMKAAVGAEKQKARERIAEIRKEKNERIAYLEKQWRQNTNWQIAELKKKAEAKRGEEHDDMIRRLAKLQAEKDQKIEDILANHRRQRQEARDRRNDRKLRVKFQKLARKALRESQNKPGLASERVQELLKDIDLTALGMRDDTRTSLHNKLLEIMEMRKTDENYLALHAEQDWKKVERLFKKQIKDMSLEEVNDLITELSALCHYQETTDRLIKDEQNRTAAEVGRQIVKDLKELTPLDITNPVKVLSAKYLRDNLSPDRAFNRLSGYKRDSAMRSLYRQVLDGYTKVKEFEKKSDELFDGFRNDPKNKEFLKNGAKQTIPVTSKYGQTALISPAMRVSLYMASRNRDNLRHISTDGMTVPEPKAYAKGLIEDAYGRGTTIVLDPVDVNKVCANMTESEKEFAGLLETFFDGYAKEAINDTSVELDGILKAIVDHYFPIASDKNFLAKSMDSFQDPTLEGWNNLKARQENANNKILLEDARQVLQRHIRNTARYYGLAIPMRNWNKVYGYTSHRDEDTGTRNSVQSAIKNAWNSDTADYIERLIRDDINSGGRKAERGVMDSMRSAYAGTTLTLNAGVALKQTTSYFMAGSILDMESLMYGLSHKFTKADQEYMDSITPWGWARRQGESTIELGEMARRKDPITKNTPNWNQAMDVITTNALFTATERSIRKEYPGLKRGDTKYDEALAERYNQVLWRTQPQYESAFRPEYLRKTDIGSRTFGMFKTESMQMSGELIDAWGQWRADEKRARSGSEQAKRQRGESAKHFYKTFASWIASNMSFAMMGTALNILLFHKGKPYRNDRGEVDWQTIATKTGMNFISSLLGGFMFASTAFDFGSYLFNIISGNKATWYDIEVPGISMINDMVTNTGNWVGTMIDEEASPSAKARATSKFVLSASKFTPLGFAGNLLKLADSLNLYIQDIREGIKTGDWHLYEAGDGFLQDTSPTKDQYANQAVYYAGQGNTERAGRALKRTKTGNLEKALGRKIGDVMFSRFVENPQDLVSYMETIAKNGGTPKLSDVPDRGFSSFTKLKEGLGSPNRNENWHHIVEQQQGPGDNNFGKFSSTQINNANNVISIPSGAGSVHKAITDYYDSVQDFTDGMTVREWLAENKTFEEQFDFGIEQLRKYGEVAPTERGWVFIPDEEKINAVPLKEGKDKELTATQKQWDTMMAEAREDGGLTDREIRAAALQMLNEGVPKDEVIELYKSKKNDKYIDEWMKYDGESGGDLSVYFGFMNAKSLGNQDGAAEYLNESGLSDDDKWALWELAGWSETNFDKKVN